MICHQSVIAEALRCSGARPRSKLSIASTDNGFLLLATFFAKTIDKLLQERVLRDTAYKPRTKVFLAPNSSRPAGTALKKICKIVKINISAPVADYLLNELWLSVFHVRYCR